MAKLFICLKYLNARLEFLADKDGHYFAREVGTAISRNSFANAFSVTMRITHSKAKLLVAINIAKCCLILLVLDLDLSCSLGCLLWEEDSVDVGQDSTRGDGDLAKQLAQLLIIAHCQLDVSRHDPGLLVVTGCIACKLQDFS